MAPEELRTTWMGGLLDRMARGDEAARDELLRHVGGRLERLTRKMLQSYGSVRRWEQTDDVLQNAVLRLLRALREVRPESTRAFFGLAALQIRRELLDLARHYCGAEGEGANLVSQAGPARLAPDAVDPAADSRSLADWCEFHRQVERLPEEEREVVNLLYYQGLTQAEAAHVLEVTERTVQRRWLAARLRLHELLAG